MIPYLASFVEHSLPCDLISNVMQRLLLQLLIKHIEQQACVPGPQIVN
jgi:hypothetical protein